jgi:hypothetical protein
MIPKAKALTTKMIELAENIRHVNAQVEALNKKSDTAKVNLAFNNLLENSEVRNIAFLNATEEHVLAMNASITNFEDHVRNSMTTEITSCEPLRRILSQSREVVCVHAVDPFTGMGMAMLISLVLFVPLILLSTKLIRLYNNINPYTKYTIHDPTSEAFATDDYGFNDRKFSISSLVYSMLYIYIHTFQTLFNA